MRYIKKINEKFKHKWKERDELIQSIWDITEDDIFDAMVDLEDLYEVEIECDFSLLSPIGKEFQFSSNDEKMEAYAAAGFIPIIKINIESNDDIRMVRSTAVDCAKSLGNWFILDINSYSKVVEIKLAQEQTGEKLEKKSSSYHKKVNNFFNSMFPEFKSAGYKIIINKAFEKAGKFYITHPTGQSSQVKKAYSILFEKKYNIDLKMIDELYQMKTCFQSCLEKLNQVEGFYDISYDIEMEGKNDIIEVIFSLLIYEK
jgi:hypothetical protein